MRATAPVWSGPQSHHAVKSVYTEENKNIRNKCWFYSNSNHWPDQCERYAALSVDECIDAGKSNHVCFSCLKKAGRDHRQANCSRRKLCTKVENKKQSSSFQHPLLHKTKTANIGVASLSDHKDSVLPVISVNISGANGVY